ncbi:MAG: methylated-DNA--[protein]-cysteine S-methyltransferase [Deltaproteobacteria bacterium]|nr:methylated-DNA--[protein]-cysteine S-methyltransferase [Deltaproteobacteria bacterium]
MASTTLAHPYVGEITITEAEGYITRISFGNKKSSGDIVERENPVLHAARQQLSEYFDGKRKTFALPLHPEGSDFQKKVWEALRAIPYGETASYKEIGERVGRMDASRAVGAANKKNPLAVIIPCHRVVGSDGRLVGYAAGLEIKEKLLALETAHRDCGNYLAARLV